MSATRAFLFQHRHRRLTPHRRAKHRGGQWVSPIRKAHLDAAGERQQAGVAEAFVDEAPSLRRWIGNEVRQAVVDVGFLRPDFWIETGRQAGLELLRRQAGDAGIVGWIACALAQVRNAACVGVPIEIGVRAAPVEANKATSEPAAYLPRRIGVLNRRTTLAHTYQSTTANVERLAVRFDAARRIALANG